MRHMICRVWRWWLHRGQHRQLEASEIMFTVMTRFYVVEDDYRDMESVRWVPELQKDRSLSQYEDDRTAAEKQHRTSP
jgi:hypothetical protein